MKILCNRKEGLVVNSVALMFKNMWKYFGRRIFTDRSDRSRLNLQRGAVLVEASLVSIVVMLIILGGLSAAAIGYARISSDGAAFYAARTYAQTISKASNSPFMSSAASAAAQTGANQLTQQLIPRSGAASFQQVAVANKGVGNVSLSQVARYGGASLTVPEGEQALVTTPANGMFGSPASISVQGVAMEPSMQIINPEFNINGNWNYSGAVSAASPLSGAVKYFGTAMDQPPYYFSQNIIYSCEVAVAWDGNCTTHWNYRAFGVAEYLDATNWGDQNLSINSGASNVFSSMLCHQRIYAYIAQSFFPIDRPTYPANWLHSSVIKSNAYDDVDPMLINDTWQQQPFKFVRAWDALMHTSYAVQSSVGAAPVSPLGGCDAV